MFFWNPLITITFLPSVKKHKNRFGLNAKILSSSFRNFSLLNIDPFRPILLLKQEGRPAHPQKAFHNKPMLEILTFRRNTIQSKI